MDAVQTGRWNDAGLALSVGVSVFAACSTATVAAMMLPWLFDAFASDPAFGSGPLATVIQGSLVHLDLPVGHDARHVTMTNQHALSRASASGRP